MPCGRCGQPCCWARSGLLGSRGVVAPQPVGLSLQPALLGAGAASVHHPRPAARGACARAGRARARGRPRHGLLHVRHRGRAARRAGRHLRHPAGDARPRDARGASDRGVTNVRPTLGDAQALPFDDDAFDAAVLVTVLGEIPDQEQALREIARVLRPGGRLVVGELFGDPHMVTVRQAARPRARRRARLRAAARQPARVLRALRDAADRVDGLRASELHGPGPPRRSCCCARGCARPRSTTRRDVRATGRVGRVVDRARAGGAAADEERRPRWLAAAGTVPLTLGLNYAAEARDAAGAAADRGPRPVRPRPTVALVPVRARRHVIRGSGADRGARPAVARRRCSAPPR